MRAEFCCARLKNNQLTMKAYISKINQHFLVNEKNCDGANNIQKIDIVDLFDLT